MLLTSIISFLIWLLTTVIAFTIDDFPKMYAVGFDENIEKHLDSVKVFTLCLIGLLCQIIK